MKFVDFNIFLDTSVLKIHQVDKCKMYLKSNLLQCIYATHSKTSNVSFIITPGKMFHLKITSKSYDSLHISIIAKVLSTMPPSVLTTAFFADFCCS